MGARESDAMKAARALILGPRQLNAYRAAKEAGITRGAISKAKWYRDHIAGQQAEGKK